MTNEREFVEEVNDVRRTQLKEAVFEVFIDHVIESGYEFDDLDGAIGEYVENFVDRGTDVGDRAADDIDWTEVLGSASDGTELE